MVKKLLCQQAGQTDKDSFKIGTMREGHEEPLSSEKVVDQTGKHSVQGDVDRGDLIIKSSKGPWTSLRDWNMSHEERLSELDFTLEKRKLRRIFYMYKYLLEGVVKRMEPGFSMAPSDKTRGNVISLFA